MHEFFSQNAAIQALKKDIAWKFWEIHIGEIDLHHQKILRAAINNVLISDPNVITDLRNGYIESKAAWDRFWQQIFKLAQFEAKGVAYASI